ncbi:hypothetical protein ACFSTH_14855 [Paenibacillus yanchengensis]|uniref:Uncharacterized protein n=1 Tax=Paenibacillus yanchengensis TaxID=2035833 RepID=A0ABW4YF15_9BACL
MTSKVKLSQWDAFQLESLRAHGLTNEDIIARIQSGDLPADSSKFKFDYADLRNFAEQAKAEFVSAVQDGYTIKYNTIYGIQNWLLVAFQVEAEVNIEPGQEIVQASLTTEQYKKFAAVLSPGWKIEIDAANEAADVSTYYIRPTGSSNEN